MVEKWSVVTKMVTCTYKGVVTFMITGIYKTIPYVIKATPEIKIEGGWLKEQIIESIQSLHTRYSRLSSVCGSCR